MVIPLKYKSTVTTLAGIATLILFVWNGIQQKSKNVTGGSVQQDLTGATVPEHKADLVKATEKATPLEDRTK
jgi:hypothetical protein